MAGSQSHSYQYDPLGNRTTVNGTPYTVNTLNQYTSVGGTPYTYDANGNLTSDGTKTYTYDFENRLTGVTGPTLNATYAYDGFGRRIKKQVNATTTYFLHDGDQVIEERGSGNVLQATYTYGPGIDENLTMNRASQTYYYFHDGLGSVTDLTKSTAELVESYQYDVYGQPTTLSTVGNPYLFTGREYDQETGLYYYRNRNYSPTIGRFLHRDPFTWAPNDTRVRYDREISTKISNITILQSGLRNPRFYNPYSYCINNPINYIDPFGLAHRQKRPLESFPFSDSGVFHHDSFKYSAEPDSGYYNDGQIREDRSPLKSKYRRASDREFDDTRLKQAEKNIEEKWLQEPYDPLKHNCQQYCDGVEREYDRLEEQEKMGLHIKGGKK